MITGHVTKHGKHLVAILDVHGQRKVKRLPSKRPQTQAEARRFLQEKIEEAKAGVSLGDDKLTFSQYMDTRRAVYDANNTSKSGLGSVRTDYAKLRDPRLLVTRESGAKTPLANVPIKEITARMAEEVSVQLPLVFQLGNHAHRKPLSRFIRILRDAAADELVRYGVWRMVKLPPKKNKRDREALLASEWQSLMRVAAAGDWMIFVAIIVAALTGARRGEFLGLKWRAIDAKRMTIFIKTNWVDGELKECRKAGDTNRIPAGPGIMALLKKHWEWMGRPGPDALVFDRGGQTPVGRPLDSDRFSEMFQMLVKVAGITRPVVLHELRHTVASVAAQVTGDLGFTQKLLGHADPQSTQVYTHYMGDAQAQVAEVESAMLGDFEVV